jgi:cytochrome d ubiquinol oxidase subunit I
VDPVRALFNPAWAVMAVHSTLSCFIATSFAVAAVYAHGALTGLGGEASRRALRMAMAVGAVTAVLQPISGHFNAAYVSRYQPTKLAAMEAQFETERGAPLRIGGWPDPETGRVDYVIEIPKGLSLLAFDDPNAEVKGLRDFPRDLWPNVRVVHLAFQIMVSGGMALVALSALYWWRVWRRRRQPDATAQDPRWLLWLLVAAGPLGFIALEAGWIVTEVGRQPWIIRNIMRVSEAVTPAPGVLSTFLAFVALYLVLAAVLTVLLVRLGRQPGVVEHGPGPTGQPTTALTPEP